MQRLLRLGQGFVPALSERRPEPERDHRAWHRRRADHDFSPGAVTVYDTGS